MPAATVHVPILAEEIVSLLDCAPGKNYLDLTFGGGGHTRAILARTAPDGIVVACDRDADALARSPMDAYGARFAGTHRAFSGVADVIADFPRVRFDGALIDAGISSDQLDNPERGFSFLREGPLDMRMNGRAGETAAELLSRLDEKAIADLIYELGEERKSRRIAKAIVLARRAGKMATTLDLADTVLAACGGRRGKIHPATRTFQAIRIAVNRELEELAVGVDALLAGLPQGARVAVMTFHSLEDRVVKNAFREAKRTGRAVLVTKKPVTPRRAEQLANPRSRSAKLRVAEIASAA